MYIIIFWSLLSWIKDNESFEQPRISGYVNKTLKKEEFVLYHKHLCENFSTECKVLSTDYQASLNVHEFVKTEDCPWCMDSQAEEWPQSTQNVSFSNDLVFSGGEEAKPLLIG